MANSGASLDRAFEELIQRVVETTMASVRGDLARLAESAVKPAGGVPSPFSVVPVTQVQEAMNAILAPVTQTDIMAAALKAAAQIAKRAALFVRRGENFTTWRSEGLSTEQAAQLKSLAASAASDGAFHEMAQELRSVLQPAGSSAWPAGLSVVAESSPKILLLPILVAGKAVAAIAVAADDSQDANAGLEIVARIAGLSLETSGSRASVPAAATQPAAAAPAPVATSAPAPFAESAAAPAPATAVPEPSVVGDNSRGSFADMGMGADVRSELPPPPDVGALPESDQESHKKAHRFARVAVQDLLSYHKTKIAEGRNNRNLYDLLREDIEKTRENYQKKFASTPAASFDYLHYEMVAKLAGNDLEVLGRNYPGPVGV